MLFGLQMPWTWGTFATVAVAKGLVELWVSRRCHTAGAQTVQALSTVFLVLGLTMPALVLAEILCMPPALPLVVGMLAALAEMALLRFRIACVRALGRHYSVDIRILEHHELVQTGPYRHFRHPLYLIALLELVTYPLAAGAYRTMLLMVALETPLILWRRRQEEAQLLAKFGSAYEAYRQRTWF